MNENELAGKMSVEKALVDDPVIHWDKIPQCVETLIVDDDGLHDYHVLDGYGYALVFSTESLDDIAFPTWRDYVGKTFKRPEES